MLKKRNIRLLRRWSALDWTCREVGEIKMASISGITSFRLHSFALKPRSDPQVKSKVFHAHPTECFSL